MAISQTNVVSSTEKPNEPQTPVGSASIAYTSQYWTFVRKEYESRKLDQK